MRAGKNLKLAQLLDDAGIDFMLPIARFTGYGGEKDFQGTVLETITWASALLASTKNLVVFATIQTASQPSHGGSQTNCDHV